VVVRDGVVVGDPSRVFRMVTLDFLAGGGDGYPFDTLTNPQRQDITAPAAAPRDGIATFAANGSEQDALAEFLAATALGQGKAFRELDTPAALDRRLQNIASRPDRVEDLSALFQVSGSGDLTVADPNRPGATGDLLLRASLLERPASVNQIGYVVLEASELATAHSLLADLTTLRARARTLLSTLENDDVTLPGDSTLQRDLQLRNGQSLRFFEVEGATLEELSSASDPRLRLLPAGTVQNDGRTVALVSPSGANISIASLSGDRDLNGLISQQQGLAPVLDLTAFTGGQRVRGSVEIGREADFDAVTGFYRVLDLEGAVQAANGIDILRPGDAGYAEAALRADNRVDAISGLMVGDDQTATRAFELREASYLAPFAQVNGNTFFGFGAANADGLAHFQGLGNGSFGLEDTLGGGDRDFDDHVLRFIFTELL
jgi:hypothetical protein